MFRRGGPSFQAQGTGITSPYDTPQTIGGGVIRGNPMGNRIGFAEPRPKEEVQTDIETIFETPKGQWLDDVIGSFGAYGAPYKESGEAKTIGEMGYEQAKGITAIRKERKEKQDLAELSGYERELEDIKTTETQANEMAVMKQKNAYDKSLIKLQGENLEFERMIKNERARTDSAIKALDKSDPKYNEKVNALETEFQNISKQIIRRTPGMTELIQDAKDNLNKLHVTLLTSTGSSYLQDGLDKWNAQAAADNDPKTTQKNITEWIGEQAVIDAATTAAAAGVLIQQEARGGLIQQKAKGGRVGFQNSFAGTVGEGQNVLQGEGAAVQEEILTPTTDITPPEIMSQGQDSSVQMPYEEFRAAIPAEVSDEIVQLIYYNQDAFADFAQITTQADVYAFNNKYGVSLVLPMDTETT
jgi:hypothetical protein